MFRDFSSKLSGFAVMSDGLSDAGSAEERNEEDVMTPVELIAKLEEVNNIKVTSQ